MRGEQYAVDYYTKNVPGSPPLARGTVAATTARIYVLRITPACAGNRLRVLGAFAALQDHPRLRGEQPVSSGFFALL